MKFTKSLAANAMASAKVPISTIGLRMFNRSRSRPCRITTLAAKIIRRIMAAFEAIHSALSAEMNEAPLEPLTRMK